MERRVNQRHGELAVSCGANLPIYRPDITSTPRPGLTTQDQDQPHATHSGGRRRNPRRKVRGSEAEEREILRGNLSQPQGTDWDHSLLESVDGEAEDDDQMDDGTGVAQGGLNLDTAGINALAHTLQRSISGNNPEDVNNNNNGGQSHHRQPTQNKGVVNGESQDIFNQSVRSSTPIPDDAAPLDDGDAVMEDADISSGARKRSRGGRKHSKDSSSNGDSGSKVPRATTSDTHGHSTVSPRGRGRPPGSSNKKFTKERASLRQTERSFSTQHAERSATSQSHAHQPVAGGPEGPSAAPPPTENHERAVVLHSNQGQRSSSRDQDTASASTDRRAVPASSAPVPATPAPWATFEVEAISEVVGLRCAGGSAEHMALNEPGLHSVDHDYQSSSAHSRSTMTELDETRVFDLRDLAGGGIDIKEGSKVRTRDVVQFVVLSKPVGPRTADQVPPHPATPWTVPEPDEFLDLINRADSFMFERNLPCVKARKWANLWGKVGLIGLSPKHPEDIADYRAVIEGLPTGSATFTLFPKEAVENRGSISIILRNQFRAFNYACLPASLFSLNPGLRGSLKVTHYKTYTKDDQTRGGASKEGWRLVLLQGCPEFMRSLERYDEDERFSLGAGYVYIRGGARKPRTNPPGRGRGVQRRRENGNNNNTGRDLNATRPIGRGTSERRPSNDPGPNNEDYPSLNQSGRDTGRDYNLSLIHI